ncbi:MAG: holo-ACP synthase [Phascolarctobacterium sp.]|nr:holo-ACP synthase [Phascolarctobacterium sp.]
MLIGVGCDVIEIARVQKAIVKRSFVERVFAPEEIAYCESRGKQAAASFAARFAAKEAVLKALGTGLRGGELTEIVITNDELGKPSVQLLGYHGQLAAKLGVKKIAISMSHSRETALAYVVMEG